MWEANLLVKPDVVFTDAVPLGRGAAKCGRGPFADAVNRQDGGLFVRRAEESAGCVRKMMIYKENLVCRQVELADQEALDPQFLIEPGNHGLAKDHVGARHGLQNAQQDTFQFWQRLFVENHVIEVIRRNAGLLQAKLNGVHGKAVIVLDAGETLFLGCSQQMTVVQQGCRGVMIETRNT